MSHTIRTCAQSNTDCQRGETLAVRYALRHQLQTPYTRKAEPHMTMALAFFTISALALGTAIAYAIITR